MPVNHSVECLNIICSCILLIIGLTFGYIFGFNRKWRAQNTGELLVSRSLEGYCKINNAHLLNCITLRLEDGSTTQIDHILISTRGVFVIETKHYTGWIFGNPKSKVWSQIIYKTKHTFQNPLFQNYKHVKAVQRACDFLKPEFIHNIVVFTGDSIFKTEKIDNVCCIKELITTIERHSDDALSLNHVQFCVGRLEYLRQELTQKTDIEHQAYLAHKFGR